MQIPGLNDLLQRYSNASASNPPETASQDFQHVAQNAPPTQVASGLADAFRSDQTPPFGQMVAGLFGQSNDQQRVGILNTLGGSQSPVTPEQARNMSPLAVQEIADRAHQKDPSIIDQASSFYAQHPTLVQGLGAGALALIMSRMSRS